MRTRPRFPRLRPPVRPDDRAGHPWERVCGFGRTGSWFGVDHAGVVPNVLAVAKGLTSGYAPMAAAVVRREIAHALPVFLDVHTYGGRPFSAVAALPTSRSSSGRRSCPTPRPWAPTCSLCSGISALSDRLRRPRAGHLRHRRARARRGVGHRRPRRRDRPRARPVRAPTRGDRAPRTTRGVHPCSGREDRRGARPGADGGGIPGWRPGRGNTQGTAAERAVTAGIDRRSTFALMFLRRGNRDRPGRRRTKEGESTVWSGGGAGSRKIGPLSVAGYEVLDRHARKG